MKEINRGNPAGKRRGYLWWGVRVIRVVFALFVLLFLLGWDAFGFVIQR